MTELSPVCFQQSLANANDFCAIKYSAVPSFKLRELVFFNGNDDRDFIYTQSGQIALILSGQYLQRDHNIILVPSYHCPAAIEPFIWLNFQCVFYRINDDLSPDEQHIEQLIAQHDITHCLTINYFGIICHLEQIINITSPHGISVIHDCAHALFSLIERPNAAIQADATICSINKVLPSIDGGMVLFKNSHRHQLSKVGVVEEIKAITYLLGITAVINKVRFSFRASSDTSTPQTTDISTAAFRYFNPSKINQQCFSHTKTLLRHSDLKLIKSARRENYYYLCELLEPLSIGKTLKQSLLPDEVPYVLPYLLNDAQDFAKVRQAGIQCLRWEEVAVTDCATSQDYRYRLIQLPCHHQLTKSQLRDMVAQIKDTL